jgi:hypothetical protein
MGNSRIPIVAILIILLSTFTNPVCAQTYSRATDYKTVNPFYDDTLTRPCCWVELDLLLNPIYISQFGGKFLLNGHRLFLGPTPRFYAVLPGTNPFTGRDPYNPISNIVEIEDQSNAAYFDFTVGFLRKSKSTFLNHSRFMVGLTHDKLETGSDNIYYKFPSGGMELTALFDHNFAYKLSDLDFKLVNLIFNVDWQAGLFASLAPIYADMTWSDSTIKSASDAGYIWQEKNPYLGGWGWITSANIEIGGVLSKKHFLKHIAFTVGTRLVMEGLYTSTQVLVNGEAGFRLKVNNYGIFFAGPVINFKYLIF